MKIKPLIVFLLTFLLFPINEMAAYPEPKNSDDPFIVVLDAGHGGHDPGNLGNGYLEKKIALNIVLKVGEILAKNKDIKVIYTRKDDTFIDLFVRGEIANKANADLFVSVHCDSHNSDAHGAGTFVLGLHANKQNFEIAKKENSVIYLEDNYENRYADYDINSPESVIGLTIMQEEFLDQSVALAKMIQDNFTSKLKRTDRKVKQAGFIVLHQTFMPSVLVETGFLTNKEEGAYLNSSKGQAEMADAISKAILNYREGVKPQEIKKAVVSKEQVKKTNDLVVTDKTLETDKKTVEVPKTQDDKTNPVQVNEPLSTTKTNAQASDATETVADNKIKPAISKEQENLSITFKVQLMATSKNVPLNSDNFKGLSNLSQEPFKNLFRYMYGDTSSYREAQMMKSRAVDKGYTTAYIVAYKLGERIPLTEAMQRVSQ